MKRIVILIALLMFSNGVINAQDVAQGAELYKIKCSACHKIGGGKLVGPDLKNVTERLETEWLHKFITNSPEIIQSGDEYAVNLYNEYNKIPMPAQPDLTNEDVDAILAYIEDQSNPSPDITKAEGAEGADAEGVIPAAAMPSINSNDTEFQLVFWFSAGLIFCMALGGAYMISRFSK